MQDNTTKHTDIKSDGWIGRIPAFMRPYVLLARLDRPIGIWLLLLPGWWAIALASGGVLSFNAYDIRLIALFGAGAIVMRAAGCVVNDLWDRKLDAKVARTQARPLASGDVRPWQAALFLSALLFAGLLILLRMPLVTVLLGFLAVPLIGIYPLMKRITWWPQLFLGIIFSFGVPMGWSAVTGLVDFPAFLLYTGAIFWTLGYDTIYAHQDKEDDLRAGIKSTALRLGPDSRRWVAGFYAAAWFFMAWAFMAAEAGWLSLALLTAAGAHFLSQTKRWDMNDPASSLTAFRSNRNAGFLVLLAAAL
ncbi:MAG: 4-hydroxybenzoate octaprenyltransferase [Proteobacteria bacterium]|nr:4-hydroxybenzoate octaprenyltransferase [Pseudomonadota bacterium]